MIRNPYDSHVHLLETALVAQQLNLRACRKPDDFFKLSRKFYLDSSVIVGFGWDDSPQDSAHRHDPQHLQIGSKQRPDSALKHDLATDRNSVASHTKVNRSFLDRVFPEDAVVFSRVDGHVYALNSAAIKAFDLPEDLQSFPANLRNQIGIDHLSQKLNGLFFDRAMELIHKKLPQPTAHQIENLYLQACRTFNRAGFTHVRDMTQNLEQHAILSDLVQRKEWTLACECYFELKSRNELPNLLKEMRLLQDQHPELRIRGVKIFLDGALGSEGACVDHAYPSGHRGFFLWELPELTEVVRATFALGLAISFHALGDAASGKVIQLLSDLSLENCRGKVDLEHVELLNLDDLPRLKKLNVTCHFQPSHYLDDAPWLKSKFAKHKRRIFAWRAVEDFQIPFFFGSDSPIQAPSFSQTALALAVAEGWGIPAPQALPWTSYHSLANSPIEGKVLFKPGTKYEPKHLYFADKKIF